MTFYYFCYSSFFFAVSKGCFSIESLNLSNKLKLKQKEIKIKIEKDLKEVKVIIL